MRKISEKQGYLEHLSLGVLQFVGGEILGKFGVGHF